jgi:hypothetical protein
MLYEMFTGQPPYDGANEVATLHKLTSGQRPPPLPRTMPAVLCSVVERALGYEPDERFTTALELNLALEGAMVEINEPTTAAIVAHYTGQLLADRKAARRRAVDTALEAARKRDPGPQSSNAIAVAPPAPGGVLPTITGTQAAPRATVPMYTESPSQASAISAGAASAPSLSGTGTGSMSGANLGEVPSVASSATLGSAAMEYLPTSMAPEGGRRKRYVAAAALGVSIAAGLAGALLIISSTLFKHDDPKPAQSSDPPATAGQPSGVASVTELDLPDDPPPATSAAPSSTGSTPPTSSTTTSTATGSVAHTDVRPPTTQHRPTQTPPTISKPKPTAPTPTKDRGF